MIINPYIFVIPWVWVNGVTVLTDTLTPTITGTQFDFYPDGTAPVNSQTDTLTPTISAVNFSYA